MQVRSIYVKICLLSISIIQRDCSGMNNAQLIIPTYIFDMLMRMYYCMYLMHIQMVCTMGKRSRWEEDWELPYLNDLCDSLTNIQLLFNIQPINGVQLYFRRFITVRAILLVFFGTYAARPGR